MAGNGRPEWRDNWPVVLGVALGVGASFPTFAFVSSLFVQPLQDQFGWSRGTQALIQNLFFVGALLAPVVGHVVDRTGARLIALIAVPGVGLCYFALALMPGSLAAYFALMGLLVTVGQGTTAVVFSRAIISRFDRVRGKALAFSRLGVSLAAAALPPLVFAVISHFGWRWGYAALGLVAMIIAWPATVFWVRERDAVRVSPSGAGARWRKLLRDPKVLVLSAATALTMGPIVGFLSQVQPLLIGKGLAPDVAASLVGVLAVAVLCGTVVTGILVDRIWAPLVGCLFTLAPVAGCLILLSGEQTWLSAGAAILLIGIAQGAELDLAGYLISRYFGHQHYSSIFGLGILLIGTTAALSGMAYGFSHDIWGHYDYALAGSALLLFAAAFLYLALGPYPEAVGTNSAAGDGGNGEASAVKLS